MLWDCFCAPQLLQALFWLVVTRNALVRLPWRLVECLRFGKGVILIRIDLPYCIVFETIFQEWIAA